MKIINIIKYLFERMSPYVVALIIVVLCRHYEFNMMIDDNYIELLNGLVTLDSIIIGFLGAIMPVILSMKNESKFVKYVFEKDKNNLFCKYLKVTVLLGIVNAVVSLVMHTRKIIPKTWQLKFYYGWIFITVAFLMATYRSMSHMISLIFTKDADHADSVGTERLQISQERGRELKNKYSSAKNK